MDIYDTKNSRLVIGPFDIEPLDYLYQVVKMPDEFILKYFSTSPEQEPPWFANNTRSTFEFMLAHPSGLIDTYFVDSKPNLYTKQPDGSWARFVDDNSS